MLHLSVGKNKKNYMKSFTTSIIMLLNLYPMKTIYGFSLCSHKIILKPPTLCESKQLMCWISYWLMLFNISIISPHSFTEIGIQNIFQAQLGQNQEPTLVYSYIFKLSENKRSIRKCPKWTQFFKVNMKDFDLQPVAWLMILYDESIKF